MEIQWDTIAAFIGAFGGLEGLKALWRRKSQRRIDRSQAQLSELHVLQETMQFVQQQLRDATEQARNLQLQLFDSAEQRHAAELELAHRRCDILDCPNRKPPFPKRPV